MARPAALLADALVIGGCAQPDTPGTDQAADDNTTPAASPRATPTTSIPLQSNAFLRVGFVNAMAHDEAGASTVERMPDTTIGFTNLKSYGFAGDFEGTSRTG